MSYFDFDFEDEFVINDFLMDFMVDQLYQFVEMYECDFFVIIFFGLVVQLDRVIVF